MPISGNKPKTYRAVLREGTAFLADIPSPEDADCAFEAFLLLQKAAGLTRESYLLRADEPAPETLLPAYRALLERRAAGEPVQYILGEWEFMGLPFRVGPGVLIPRPETELLAETALAHLRSLPTPRILELCGGSGCLAVSLSHYCPGASAVTLELSPEALRYLRENLRLNRCDHVQAVEGDALHPPEELLSGTYDLILSNPPYVAERDLPRLQREVQKEPRMALAGGPDGLSFYRAFTGIYPPLLAPGGMLAFEIGEDQMEPVTALMEAAGLSRVTPYRDLSGNWRVVTGIRRP